MGRIDLKIDDDLKNKLKAKLALEGRTITEWIIEQVKIFLKKGGKKKKK